MQQTLPPSEENFSSEENSLYFSFYSQNSFLSYSRTSQLYVENLDPEQVANQFFRILKRTNASESIRTVGFNTKKFNKSESNRVIYAKELLGIYENLRFFNEYIRQNKTIVITDNLPAKYLVQSGKTRDVFVYSTISKLVQEFPKVEIS